MSGGISATSENRILDWQERPDEDDIFGAVVGKSRRSPVEELTDEFLKKDWTQDTIDDGVVLATAWSDPDKNKLTWEVNQVIALKPSVPSTQHANINSAHSRRGVFRW